MTTKIKKLKRNYKFNEDNNTNGIGSIVFFLFLARILQ